MQVTLKPPLGFRLTTAVRSHGWYDLPPFGWDELSAHRSLRAWAGALASAGHTALRMDLPGTGDSGGSANEPGLVSTWCSAVRRRI